MPASGRCRGRRRCGPASRSPSRSPSACCSGTRSAVTAFASLIAGLPPGDPAADSPRRSALSWRISAAAGGAGVRGRGRPADPDGPGRHARTAAPPLTVVSRRPSRSAHRDRRVRSRRLRTTGAGRPRARARRGVWFGARAARGRDTHAIPRGSGRRSPPGSRPTCTASRDSKRGASPDCRVRPTIGRTVAARRRHSGRDRSVPSDASGNRERARAAREDHLGSGVGRRAADGRRELVGDVARGAWAATSS